MAVKEATKEDNREVGLNNDQNRYKREKKKVRERERERNWHVSTKSGTKERHLRNQL